MHYRYIYGGILSLKGQDPSDILSILVASNKLLLQELVDYLQKYLIEKECMWMEKHFELIHQTSFQSNNFLELQQFCTDLIAKSPEKIFKSFDFISLPEKSLVSLIKRDDLRMKEIEVWEHALKWGLAKNPTLIPDPATWTENDFKAMENTLQNCLPLIRFFSFSSKEFTQKVRPYKKLLKHQFYEDLVNSYMNPDSEPIENILLPRNTNIDGIIDSSIVNLNIVSIISRWIDKVDINSKFAYSRELYFPYKFKLLLRGSRDGFNPKKFHSLCDNKSFTVTFIKVKGTEEILGGYNPLIWESLIKCGETKDSFIFSFKSKDSFIKDAILSNVKDMSRALFYHKQNGPCFSRDLIIYSSTSNEFKDYDNVYCKQESYERKIRDAGKFYIEDYEVFQIIRK